MLGVFYARLRPLTSLSLSCAAISDRRIINPPLHTLPTNSAAAASSIWHAIMPSYLRWWRSAVSSHREATKLGEGSWNVAWDARPARWLHHSDSFWILFGVCASLAPVADLITERPHELRIGAEFGDCDYRVTGVAADGRCLFRAIAHMACLAKGENAPDENRQRELADDLRARVVEELLKRRKEVEWSIEEDFDTYVKRIQEPYVWGGEPELLMCSHVLRTPICVFMKDGSSNSFSKIANYGEEYSKDEENSINVLFHGYGHYDILEPRQVQA